MNTKRLGLDREHAREILKGFISNNSDLKPNEITDDLVIFETVGEEGFHAIRHWVEEYSSVSDLSVHFVSLKKVTVRQILECFWEVAEVV